MDKYWVVIPAAGSGSRMGGEVPKQYLSLAGKTVIEHTLQRFLDDVRIAGIVVAISPDDRHWHRLNLGDGPQLLTTPGGAERCHSVLAGLSRLEGLARADDWVLVHDAARPCLRGADIDRLIIELADHPVGGLLGLPVKDTMKRGGLDQDVVETVDRDGLWHALTPQMFRYSILVAALKAALEKQIIVTDEAQAVELNGATPRLVEGQADNIKITRPQDLALAELYLQQQLKEVA